MKKVKKFLSSYTFNVLLIVALTLIVLYLTLQGNTEELIQTFRNANLGWVLLILALVLLIRILSGCSTKIETNLTHPEHTLWQSVVNAMTGGFFSAITPSATGGQFAQVYIFRIYGVPMSDSIGILWMDFIIYQAVMLLSVLLLIILRLPTFLMNYSRFFSLVILGFIVNAAVIVGLWALFTFPKFYTWIMTTGINIGSKLHLIKEPEKARSEINVQLKRFQEEVTILKSNRTMVLKSAACNFIRLMIYYSLPFFCAKALNVEVHVSQLLDILALSSFVSMINAFIPLPGAAGGTEATFLLMFSTIFSSVDTRAMMLLWRFTSYYFDMILGALVFFTVKLRHSKLG